jgi:hypothetical protein
MDERRPLIAQTFCAENLRRGFQALATPERRLDSSEKRQLPADCFSEAHVHDGTWLASQMSMAPIDSGSTSRA